MHNQSKRFYIPFSLERFAISHNINVYAMLMTINGRKYIATIQNKLYAVSIIWFENDPNVTHCIKPGTCGCSLTWKIML